MSRQPTIINENLKKLRRLISTVVTCIILMKPNKNKKKMTRKEINDLTEHFRIRVEEIEQRKKTEMLEITNMWRVGQSTKNLLSAKGVNTSKNFPFLTFNDDKYSEFMTLIMQNLELRLFKKGELIYRELDECHEVIFVFSGRYNVGYELNTVRRYRKQVGPSTVIGGF